MRRSSTILDILEEPKVSKNNKKYIVQHFLLSDRTEATMLKSDYKIGERVVAWFDEEYGATKFKRVDKA